jgi:hypothetical protein
MKVLEPDSLLERFAAKKANKVGKGKDFINMKGHTGQVEMGKSVKNQNEKIGFKCVHYSVTESSKVVKISVVKKVGPEEVTVGIRTIDGSAKSPTYFKSKSEIITMGPADTERIFEIEIIDNEEWGPDLDFYVELYDHTKTPNE